MVSPRISVSTGPHPEITTQMNSAMGIAIDRLKNNKKFPRDIYQSSTGFFEK